MYLLEFQVYDVIHDTLCLLHMVAEEFEVEARVLRKRLINIGIEVDSEQTATVVRAEGNLAARVGADGAEAEVGVAVGHALSQDGIPEEHSWLGALPGVVDDFPPEGAGIDFLLHHRIGAVDGELLGVGAAFGSSLHEGIVNLHADVGSGDLSLDHLCVDEAFCVGVLDGHGKHQCSAAPVLSHLARTIAISLHEGHQSCAGQGRVLHR